MRLLALALAKSVARCADQDRESLDLDAFEVAFEEASCSDLALALHCRPSAWE